ncbi:hypothetical protein BT96DRAFT_811151 [Gymnopus androsaceus JB14]|uniref:Uncharacterized protein n=1 Tax=Gymnopus androsaceus JB14 TaxID=1447944 RepID=A0A6A4I6S7_9AGAR|nr:hypothetical protein BT96DRAFT_811151 [Gymnopus androsaceus JB14]
MDSLPPSSAGTSSSYSESYGNSRKPSSSSVLWAHLLRKDALTASVKTDAPLQPLAPVDKSGTSTRILLLDTQAHLQKFGRKVDDLTSKVAHAKQEIVTVKTLFQQDREGLMSEFVDLLNRSQLEIQKTIGEPAQASKCEDLEKIVEVRLESMDQRLAALQMVSVVNQISSSVAHACP